MKDVAITISGYRFDIQPQDGLDNKQRLYNDFMQIFKGTMKVLISYPDTHPLNPKDRIVYMKYSRICKKKILELQAKFIDGMIQLDEDQHKTFCFITAREILANIDKMCLDTKSKFSYSRLHEHFRQNVYRFTLCRIFDVIPPIEYYTLNDKFRPKILLWMR